MNMKNKTIGFYLLIVAAVLSVVGVFFYSGAEVTSFPIIVMVVVSAVVAVAAAVLAAAKPGLKFLNLTATVCAVLLAWALVQSVTSQLDPLGWWVSGLYTLDQVMGFLVFAALSGAAILLYLVTSFVNLEK